MAVLLRNTSSRRTTEVYSSFDKALFRIRLFQYLKLSVVSVSSGVEVNNRAPTGADLQVLAGSTLFSTLHTVVSNIFWCVFLTQIRLFPRLMAERRFCVKRC
jgi:hypothetical protein